MRAWPRRGRTLATLLCLMPAAARVDAGPPVYQVLDIVPGAGSSDPMELQPATALFSTTPTVLFSATTPAAGRELWRTDGTSASTVMIKDIDPGVAGGNPLGLVRTGVFSSTVWFSEREAANGRELWKSDGTPGDTVLVRDINPGATGSGPGGLTAIGGLLFFTADDGTNGHQLWISDGTFAGTAMVADLEPAGSSAPEELTAWNGILHFTADVTGLGRELYRSDGTPAGTYLVRDVNLGAAASTPERLTASGGALFFRADGRRSRCPRFGPDLAHADV